MFPVKGGGYNPVNKKIRKHESVPIVSTQRVCIRNCATGIKFSIDILLNSLKPLYYLNIFIFIDEELAIEEKPKLVYNVQVKLLNVGENFHAPSPGSTDFDILASTVTAGFKKKLSKFPGFQKMDIVQFSQ